MKHAMKPDGVHSAFRSDQVAALRLSIAALALLPFSIQGLRRMKISNLKWIALVGLIGSGIPAFLFTASQQYLDSGVAGILNSLTPLFTLLVGVVLFKRVTEPRQAVGVLIGLGGAAALISLKGFGASSQWSYGLLIAIATFSYGLSVNVVQSKLKEVKSLHITAISLLIAGIPCGIYAIYSGVPEVISQNQHGVKGLMYVGTLALLGTAMANMLYFWLTKETSALFASSVTYLMPLVAVAWGLGDGEVLGILHLMCGLIILSGVWLVSYKKKSTA
jgi:drug/metabolite transporter (DMT)-like permease